jgi:hypothetical protein
MDARFVFFVIYANMRSGWNFLEVNINDYPGLTCYGEAFNPVFIGGPKKTDLLGVTLEDREADPINLLTVMQSQTEGLPGFRFFHDHDPRILDRTLKDPRCGKIILTRNPIDSYVSRKIAAKTGQWRLNDLKNAKKAKIAFDRAEFEAHLDRLQGFQLHLMRGLQATGQTAFYIGYEDIANLDVLDGVAAFLGVDHQKDRTTIKTKVQNPGALEDKVENFEEMQAELAAIDRFDLTRTPNFEPRRPPAVPKYVAARYAPLLFQPIKSNPQEQVLGWMALLDRVEPEDLPTDFNQKTLRQWQRDKPAHRSFTVLRHPVKRLHQAFVDYILGGGPKTYKEIRRGLRKKYGLPLPEVEPGDDWTTAKHRAAFLAFIRFVQGNLAGQTGVRVDGAWASQTEIIAGFTRFRMPDVVMREDTLEAELSHLASLIGQDAPELPMAFETSPVSLEQVYNDEIESAVRSAYQRDYLNFGFGRYRKT